MIIIADGSHWVTMNVDALRAGNVSGLMWKATQGGGYVDPTYEPTRKACKNAGMPFLAFHYQDESDSVQEEFENVRRTVSTDIPLVLDVEKGSGPIMRTRHLYSLLTNAGYHIPFMYYPRWYWDYIGRPSLAGLPPLWASHYVTGPPGTPQQMAGRVPVSWWEGYGGNAPALLQYTQRGKLPGQTLGDYSLFHGDTAQFLRYLNRDNFEYYQVTEKDTMIAPKGKNVSLPIAVPPSRQCDLIIAPGNAVVNVHHCYTWGDVNNQGTGYDATEGVEIREFDKFVIPKGTGKIDLQYTSDDQFSYVLDVH